MPPSYQLGVMSPPPAPCPYPPATSPALHQQYQYRAAPAAPMRVAVPCSDYYIPVMNEQRSYPVNIPNSQQQQPQQQCFTGVYETRACTPTTLPGTFCSRNVYRGCGQQGVGWRGLYMTALLSFCLLMLILLIIRLSVSNAYLSGNGLNCPAARLPRWHTGVSDSLQCAWPVWPPGSGGLGETSGPMCKPCRNGNEGRIGIVSRCSWCAATATFLLAVRVCSVCLHIGFL